MANKPKIKLKVSDIEIENMRDGEPSIGSLSSNSNDILVQIKDETAGTRKSIEKLNDVMSRLVDAFSASLMLQKKETTRQIAKDQREKTKDDIADDVKERKQGRDNPFAVGMAAAANPFATLGAGLGKMAGSLGIMIHELLRNALAGVLSLLGFKKLSDMIRPGGGLRLGGGTSNSSPKPSPPTKVDPDPKMKPEKPKGSWKKAFDRLARGLGTAARVAGVVGLPFLAYEVIEFMAPYARKAMQERMKEATEREEKIAKEINESISKFKKEQMDMQAKLNAAVLAGDENLIKKLETEMAKKEAEFSEELEKKQVQLDAARAELQRERQRKTGKNENRVRDEDLKAAYEQYALGKNKARNEAIMNKGKVQDYLDMVRSHLKDETSKEELQEFIKSQGGMDKFKKQINAYAPGILGNTDPGGEVLKTAKNGGETNVQRRQRLKKEESEKFAGIMKDVKKADEEFGDQGMDMMYDDPEKAMKDYRRRQERDRGIQLAKQRKARAINVREESIGKTTRLNDHKNVHDMSVMEYQSGTTVPTPSAVRVDDFGSMPERSKGLIESVANTVTDAFSWLKGKLKKEEEIEIQKVQFNKEETEYMKKVSQDIETLNKFFTEGNNVMIINKGGDTVINDGRVTNLNNSQQMALGSGSVFPIVG